MNVNANKPTAPDIIIINGGSIINDVINIFTAIIEFKNVLIIFSAKVFTSSDIPFNDSDTSASFSFSKSKLLFNSSDVSCEINSSLVPSSSSPKRKGTNLPPCDIAISLATFSKTAFLISPISYFLSLLLFPLLFLFPLLLLFPPEPIFPNALLIASDVNTPLSALLMLLAMPVREFLSSPVGKFFTTKSIAFFEIVENKGLSIFVIKGLSKGTIDIKSAGINNPLLFVSYL